MPDSVELEPELIPFAAHDEREWIQSESVSPADKERLLVELRRRLAVWRTNLKPTREQLLQITHEENRIHARLDGGNAQFWEGLDADWRRKQKPTDWKPEEEWSPKAREWLETERLAGRVFNSEKEAGDAFVVSQRPVFPGPSEAQLSRDRIIQMRMVGLRPDPEDVENVLRDDLEYERTLKENVQRVEAEFRPTKPQPGILSERKKSQKTKSGGGSPSRSPKHVRKHEPSTPGEKWLLMLSSLGDVILAMVGGTQPKLWVSLVMLIAACAIQIVVILKVQPFRARKWNVLLGVALVVILTSLWWGARPDVPPTDVPRPTPELHGVLVAANELRPLTDCQIPQDAVALFLGDSVGYTTGKLIAIHAGDDELVSIRRETAGIYVSARVYSEVNKVSVSISDNEMFVNPGNYFEHPDRSTDWHTLIVKDNSGAQVLYVSYMNKTTIKLLGTFWTPLLKWPIVIGEHHIHIPGVGIEHQCMGEIGMFDITKSSIGIGSGRP